MLLLSAYRRACMDRETWSKEGMHRALQQEPLMEVRQLESGRLGVSKQAGLGWGPRGSPAKV